MAKKVYSTPSVEIESLLEDVLMASPLENGNDNTGEDKDWGLGL